MKHFRILLSTLFLLLSAWIPASAGPFTLVIDAGHGGNDPGAVGASAKEKTINLNVALAFGKLVEQNCQDVKVIYTRKTDVFIPLQERANIANRAKADLFISIHTNAVDKSSPGVTGAETYTLGMHRAADNLAVAKRENSVITMEAGYKQKYQGFDPGKAESYIIFELMQDKHMAQSVKLAKAIQQQYAANGRKNKGVHQAGFLVLRETSMPSVLTELGFISSPTEEAFLSSTDGVAKMARSLYEGFRSYRRQLAMNDEPAPADDAPLMAEAEAAPTPAAVPESTDKPYDEPQLAQYGSKRSNHFNEGATAGALEDEVPTIRPVKTIPYPTADAATTEAKVPETAQPAETSKPAEASKPQSAEASKPKPAEASKPQTPAPPKKPEPQSSPAAAKADAPAPGKPEFRIQLFTAEKPKKEGDPFLKGLPAEYYMDGTTYKYTYGRSTNYNEIVGLKKTIEGKFPGVFVIALVDGKRIDLQEAIKISKQK